MFCTLTQPANVAAVITMHSSRPEDVITGGLGNEREVPGLPPLDSYVMKVQYVVTQVSFAGGREP